MADPAPGAPSLREFTHGDTSRVAAFLSANFANSPAAVWEQTLIHILSDNPWSGGTAPMGWVLEHPDEGVVGFLGNVPHPFHVLDSEVRAAATTAWCVSSRYRSLGLLLAAAFLEQENTDLLFNTTANRLAGELFVRLGFQRVPCAALGSVMYWVTDPAGFLQGAALHATNSQVIARIATIACALPLTLLERSRGRSREYVADGSSSLSSLTSFGDEWQQYWEAWRQGLITGVRTRPQMTWRLAGVTHKIAVRDADGALLGYAACRRHVDYGGSLVRLRVVDLWTGPGRPDIVRALVGAARELARTSGCACLEVFGMSEAVREALAPMRPRWRRLSSWPYYVRARGRTLSEVIATGKRWHPTGYDGDSPFTMDAG